MCLSLGKFDEVAVGFSMSFPFFVTYVSDIISFMNVVFLDLFSCDLCNGFAALSKGSDGPSTNCVWIFAEPSWVQEP